ncbi:unnamed protein product [Toxocara canis]|uniref:RNase_Zc3h12a domain-containing protein n=1 Tax=Toxocara canis TaxID=6265 RepID=A0A183UJT4_TOXCA|nr:unnamed protein product [Toxocara canis]
MSIIRFLLIRDIDVVAFLPIIYNNNCNFNATNAHVLPKLKELDVLTFTPARMAHGSRPAFINYDDLYILEFAERHGGSVLSGDRFEDVAIEPSYKEFRRIIKERRIDIRFRPLPADVVHYGRDRFFKSMPELWAHDGDTGTSLEERMQKRLYCLPTDSDYIKVANRRHKWSSKRKNIIIASIDALFDAIAAKSCTLPKVIPYVSKPIAVTTTLQTRQVRRTERLDTDFRRSQRNGYRLPDHIGQEELARLWLSPSADEEQPTTELMQQDEHVAFGVCPSNNFCKFFLKHLTHHFFLSIPKTSATSTYAEDAEMKRTVELLKEIFDEDIVRSVVSENASRDLQTLADICAQKSAPSIHAAVMESPLTTL